MFVFRHDPAWPHSFLLWNQIICSSSTGLGCIPLPPSSNTDLGLNPPHPTPFQQYRPRSHPPLPHSLVNYTEQWKSSFLYQLTSLVVLPKTIKEIRSAKAFLLKCEEKKCRADKVDWSHVLDRSVALLISRYIELIFNQLDLFLWFDRSTYFSVSRHCVLSSSHLLYLTELLTLLCLYSGSKAKGTWWHWQALTYSEPH